MQYIGTEITKDIMQTNFVLHAVFSTHVELFILTNGVGLLLYGAC